MGDAISAFPGLITPQSNDEIAIVETATSTTKRQSHDNLHSNLKRLRTDIKALANDTVAIDFNDNEEVTITFTVNPTFTTSNRAIGKHKIIHIDPGASNRTVTFPSWIFYGTKPTTFKASKKSILSLTCLGTTDALIRAVFAEEA